MSYGRMAEIRCDIDTCDNAYGDYGTVAQVRDRAKAAGWRVAQPGGKDYCDEHADAISPKEQQ